MTHISFKFFTIFSRLHLPHDYKLREIVRVFIFLKGHIFCLGNKGGLLLLNNFIESFCYCCITGTRFSNDKIEENDASHNNGETPKDPEDYVLWHLEWFRIIYSWKVTHAHPEGPHELTEMESDSFVVCGQVFLEVISFFLCFQICSQLSVS